jgi:hypothetical protein
MFAIVMLVESELKLPFDEREIMYSYRREWAGGLFFGC